MNRKYKTFMKSYQWNHPCRRQHISSL